MRLSRLFQALRTERDLQVKAGKNRKAVVQDNSVLARIDDAITFRLLHRSAPLHCTSRLVFVTCCSRSSTKDLADDDDVDFLISEDANVRDALSCAC